MIISILYLLIGSVLLYFGADWMIKSSVHIASKLNISRFVIGLTIVAFGTSLPELGVSLKAALFNKSDIAIGNIIGSNITNVLLVLGLSSMFNPILISFSKIKKDILIYLFVCILLVFLLQNGILERWEGVLLFTGIIFYTIHSFVTDKSHDEDFEDLFSTWRRTIIFLVLGIILLYIGSESFIKGAVDFAKIIGVSDLIIGMSVVALGTSLPELVTSVFAAVKKEHSISVGNIIGSNLFNILSVLGLVSIIKPLSVESSIFRFEIPIMIAAGLLLIPISLRQRPISKVISLSMLFGYSVFICILFT
ncbi:MAG: calcium/sodium antiporter [Candidatus Marinimicrobia bacterium]|jgi:cation:H+ antiporter|nr:calcium/sodium antiporter [Candidatus Neomarinimicrobiota bacterium]HJM46423.1 calcium/sodium antiporter [Candidatus Neomarinimicrobiota bacterium]|tara:strand:+ start:1793 stop:2713 length:921 start_codon:yes stop_codon:yes gene_type:complete